MSHRMVRGAGLCGLPDGHKGNHRSAASFTPEIRKKRNADWYERSKQRDPEFMLWMAERARRRYSAGGALQEKYKRTLEDYGRLLEEQGGGCVICGRKPDARPLSWDHDHRCCPRRVTCGKCVRGLLCQRCNTLVSWLERPELMAAAYKYLEVWDVAVPAVQ